MEATLTVLMLLSNLLRTVPDRRQSSKQRRDVARLEYRRQVPLAEAVFPDVQHQESADGLGVCLVQPKP